MTPEQRIKWAALLLVAKWDKKEPPRVNENNVDDLYEELVEKGAHWDALNEIREGEVETNISCDYSRHYESKSVAAKMPDDSWIGWTYWYGGGKHAEPEAIDWMSSAYKLECEEEKQTIVVRKFWKPEEAAA
ncbi:MAG: hypothetical protein ACRBBW_12935 [Cellvibrionaceae bacterium]